MSSIAESVSDAQHSISEIQRDPSTPAGMINLPSLFDRGKHIFHDASFLREVERYLTCWSTPRRGYGREKEGRN